ncbi:MAG: hypothetical protein ASARMPRED_000213 [Alectoria sarmentosa]|nr:MAG: hypothetical protein ASARMPRED_000213 [Alectoria sarmentosa]
MRFLCLAGSGTNAETFRMQILPIVQDLEQDATASFHFIHGDIDSLPPNGFEEFFGSPPHRRFVKDYCSGSTDTEFFDAIRNAPYRLTPEQKYRELVQSLRPESTNHVQRVLDRLYRVLDHDGPFDGIIGNSEGACVAATFVVDYLSKCARKEIQHSLKCAVFMSGGPPAFSDGSGFFLADEYGQAITMPTCHIIAYNDALIDGAVALYHLCDQASATIVDHSRGHMVPRDPKSSKLMVKGIRDLIVRATISSPA